MWESIREFHQRFELEPQSPKPALLQGEMAHFRAMFLEEELGEYHDSCSRGDLAGAADALVDLVVVALGTAYLMNLPWNELWNEVMRCNMAKVRAQHAGESKRGSSFDVVKPEGWTPPRIHEILREKGHEKGASVLTDDGGVPDLSRDDRSGDHADR